MFFGKPHVDIWFKDTEEGRAFYPYGAAGSGYLLSAPEEAAVRARLGSWLAVCGALLFAQIVLQALIGIGPTLPLLAVPDLLMLLLYYGWLHRSKARWTKASARITRTELRRSYAAGMSKTRLAFLLAASALMTAASAALLAASLARREGVPLICLGATAFFGWCFVSGVRLARFRG